MAKKPATAGNDVESLSANTEGMVLRDDVQSLGLSGSGSGDAGANSLKDSAVGSWQCPHCHLTSSVIWRGTWNPDDAPTCCGGIEMLPYRIPSREALDVKIVSRWIGDIETEQRDAELVYDEIAAAARDGAGL